MEKKRKLMILGGANAQIPAILRAKEMGCHVITGDYLPGNPGHVCSDAYVNVSTTDREKVLQHALRLGIDGISAYASDPAAETEAYVCERMGLPGNRYEAVRIFSQKDLFRKFQKENGFYTPSYVGLSDMEELDQIRGRLAYPCFVKPVDSSGSKGVTRLVSQAGLEAAAQSAFRCSRAGRIIVEEAIESPYPQLHGDCFLLGGKIVFSCLGDQRFKGCVPIGSSMPSALEPELIAGTVREAARLAARGGLTQGAVNLEARITADRKIYILEMGPRAGGNYIPQLVEETTGFDEMTACLQAALGDAVTAAEKAECEYCFQYIIGAEKKGRFVDIALDDEIGTRLRRLYIHKKAGDTVPVYTDSSGVVGVAVLAFDSREEMERAISKITEHIKVIVEENE